MHPFANESIFRLERISRPLAQGFKQSTEMIGLDKVSYPTFLTEQRRNVIELTLRS